ncbi:helix-turn-helix transcriptional regulator [Mesorhizobium loti NZP2037]|nr:helix-turn-helix transcriptional regulator [Mesorhizobium loti]ANN57799.1 helix-turn-helix transcriptional regulator [Mesorhizobium loti NZP2037]
MIARAENLQRLSDFADEISASRKECDPETDTSSFVVNGHSLVAIRYADDRGDPNNHADQRRPVGRIVCAGTQYLIYDAVCMPGATADLPLSAAEILTRRELQIALLISNGKVDKEIARQLGISGYTVREHIRRIFAKLNIGRRSAIASCVLAGRADFRQDAR